MMSNHPSTPVKVASSAPSYTVATLDPDLRSQINTLLLRENHVARIQETLLHSLHSHPGNWPTMVQSHALSLLRSGEVNSFPALIRRVLDDVRQDVVASAASTAVSKPANGADVNGKKVNGDSSQTQYPLALPNTVVDEALKIARDCLEAVCELEENGTS